MFRTARFWQVRLLAVLSLPALAAACDAGGSVSPNNARRTAPAMMLADAPREADLGSCTKLAVPSAATMSAHLYAIGTQNYMWNGTTWYFIGPSAELFANAAGNGNLGIHYAGPTWVSRSGSGVVGRVADKCTADANSIPWLLLTAVSSRGPGIFEGTTYIQRVNTVGGLAPTTPGTTYGQQVKVPYTAEYVFYR